MIRKYQTCLLSYLFCILSTDKPGSRIFCQGGGGGGGGGSRPDCQQRIFVVFFSPQLILQFYGYFKETIISQGFRGGPTFSRGGGGVQILISIKTHLTCDFPEGSGHLSPPLDPHMTHLCTKISVVRLWKFCMGNSHEV